MFGNPSLVTRIAIGKAIGLVIGAIGFVSLPWLLPDAGWHLRLGVLLWYTTLGALIGMAGVFTWHPVLKLPLAWWFRAPLLGAWMNFVLTLFVHDTMAGALTVAFGEGSLFASPWWFVPEGAAVGLLIGFVATRFGGKGAATVTDAPSVSPPSAAPPSIDGAPPTA